MKSTVLRFYMHENRKLHGRLLYEWLLEHAKKMGIHGGSAFRAIAGYGRHGVLHEQHFFELAGDLPVIFTERLPLQQVLSNLIGNAVKYGPEGTTVIEVSVLDIGTHYEFAVQDNGPGIHPAYHDKIFGLFQTLREKTDKESTGIGLSIVKKIVEERGGVVRLVSSPGNGAKFIFTWPKNS